MIGVTYLWLTWGLFFYDKLSSFQTEDINSESEITTVQYKHLQASTITQTFQV